MKKRIIITTEKREVWVIRSLSDEAAKEGQERTDAEASHNNSPTDKIREKDETSEKWDRLSLEIGGGAGDQ